jgi:SAM-dependent methyltransferase
VTLAETLRAHHAAWDARPLVRRLYREWFELVTAELSTVDGRTVELGAGISKFAEGRPDVLATDVEPTAWAEHAADAEALPFDDRSLANLVLIDVFHHLARPASFFDEAERVLVPGGRVVMLEPFCSPVSTLAYHVFHHERVDLSEDPFAEDLRLRANPALANQARATIAFFRRDSDLERRWPVLTLVHKRRLAVLAYPLSGGFGARRLVPDGIARPLLALDHALEPFLAPAAAFRCLVVLQRG